MPFQFWQEAVDGWKIASIFLRSIFNPTHHSLPFLVLFLAVGMDLVGKCWGGNSGLSVLAKNSGRVVLCVTTPGCVHHNSRLCVSQLPVVRAQKGKKSQKNHPPQPSIMVITRQGDYTMDKNVASISKTMLLFMLYQPYDVAFYAYQPVMRHFMLISCGKNWNWVYAKRLFSAIRSVQLDFTLPPKHPKGTF